MGMLTRSTYRTQWPRIAGALAMGVAGATVLAANTLTKRQRIAALNFAALLVHQYEEYCDPGYFPGQFNRGLFKSDTPRTYPLNTDTAMWINTAIAYPFYLAPVVFPAKTWLGLAPALFGMGQAVAHGTVFARLGRVEGHTYTYSPGFLAALLLHVPLGVAYVRALREDGPIGHGDWAKGIAYLAASAPIGIVAPNIALRKRASPYAFTEAQMGPYATAD